MTSRDFCFWLQGYFEILDKNEGLTASKTEMIKAHLQYVFDHEIFPPAEPGGLAKGTLAKGTYEPFLKVKGSAAKGE